MYSEIFEKLKSISYAQGAEDFDPSEVEADDEMPEIQEDVDGENFDYSKEDIEISFDKLSKTTP